MTIKRQTKMENYVFCLLTTVFCVLLLAGCQEQAKSPKPKAIAGTKPETGSTSSIGSRQAGSPQASEAAIKRENAELTAQNKQLKEQLETLMGIDKPARIEAVSTLSSIELTGRCGIREEKAKDSNDTTKKKMLVVYLKTIDDMGDVVKSPGAVKVELWDLNTKPAEALLGTWQIEPKDLKKHWSGSLFTSYYKLPFDVNSIVDKKELTLKVEFTDYLTGKIFKQQRVIKP